MRKDTPRDRPVNENQIVVTSEMIAAGEAALARFNPSMDPPEVGLFQIFSAMCQKCPACVVAVLSDQLKDHPYFSAPLETD